MCRYQRILIVILALGLVFLFAACSGVQTEKSSTEPDTAENRSAQTTESRTQEEDAEASENMSDISSANANTAATDSLPNESSGSDILVVYFSRTGEQYGVGVIDEGNTAIVANTIAEATGADTFEILPTDDHYPMTYDALTDVAKQEQNENARPAYAGGVPDLSQYSTVFIGAPVWWGDWPMICYTFFENEDLSGKTLYPFSTHAGSGLSGFDKKLSSAVPDAMVGEGLAISGTDCQNNQDGVRSKVNDWLSGLNY